MLTDPVQEIVHNLRALSISVQQQEEVSPIAMLILIKQVKDYILLQAGESSEDR